MQKFQKLLLILAAIGLGYSIWYYMQIDRPQPTLPMPVDMTIPDDVPPTPIPEKHAKPFDVRDYGVEGEEIDRMNDYFSDVKREVGEIIAREEKLFVTLRDFKTEDDYKRKLYMALSLINRIKVVSPTACERLKKKFNEITDPDQKEKIKRSQEYIVCVPGKW